MVSNEFETGYDYAFHSAMVQVESYLFTHTVTAISDTLLPFEPVSMQLVEALPIHTAQSKIGISHVRNNAIFGASARVEFTLTIDEYMAFKNFFFNVLGSVFQLRHQARPYGALLACSLRDGKYTATLTHGHRVSVSTEIAIHSVLPLTSEVEPLQKRGPVASLAPGEVTMDTTLLLPPDFAVIKIQSERAVEFGLTYPDGSERVSPYPVFYTRQSGTHTAVARNIHGTATGAVTVVIPNGVLRELTAELVYDKKTALRLIRAHS